jgi:hypothetical protein
VEQKELLRSLAKVANTLRAADVPFALTGGCAVYARGGPPTTHDVDVLVIEEDVPRAVSALVAQGMRAADTPLDWLAKVYDGDRLVDLLHHPNAEPVTAEVLKRAEWMRVGAAEMPVATATDLMIDKLLVFGPHRCDFTEVLPIARALREQVDWQHVADRTVESPYAEAFLLLLKRLDIEEVVP